MAKITFHEKPVHTYGNLPPVGSSPKNFHLLRNDLSEVTLDTYSGKIKVLNIFPSIDTPVCATTVRRFNQEAAKAKNAVILNISADLPFAQARFCGAEGIKNVETLSCFRSTFGEDWGVKITDSPLKGLLSRAVIVLDKNNKVIYSEQVSEITHEPSYDKALKTFL